MEHFNHSNITYNYLTCIKRLDTIKGATIWLCKCICGKEKPMRISQVKDGRHKSCGCMKNQMIKEKKTKSSGEASFNRLCSQLKIRANRRNLEFSLSKDFIKEITQMNCHYCGIEPFAIYKTSNDTGSYIYNGIDRIDSNIGYIEENCWPCCKFCNFSKNNLSIGEFKNNIERIYNFWAKNV